MILEQLPELEDVERCLTESEIQQASQFNQEWNGHVNVQEDQRNWIVKGVVVLHDRRCLLENWEAVLDLEG